MVADAESHAAEDKTRRELIDARNQGDALAYSVERTLNDHRGKLSAEDARRVENAINDVRDALKSEDVGAIKRATEVLQQSSHTMAEQMYKQNQSAGPAHHAGPTNRGGSNVQEGEVVDAEVVNG